VDPNQKTMMVEGFVAAFAKAARVSDVPEEAITSDTREPSYMFWRLSGTGRRLASVRTCSQCYLAASSRWRPMISACRSRT
jgi:hypothetical protein